MPGWLSPPGEEALSLAAPGFHSVGRALPQAVGLGLETLRESWRASLQPGAPSAPLLVQAEPQTPRGQRSQRGEG